MSNQNPPPPGPGWGSPPPPEGDPPSDGQVWQPSPPEGGGLGDPPSGGGTWQAPPPPEGAAPGDPPTGGDAPQAPRAPERAGLGDPPGEGGTWHTPRAREDAGLGGPSGGADAWQSPPPPESAGSGDPPGGAETSHTAPPETTAGAWEAPDPSWAPPPPPPPRPRVAGQFGSGMPEQPLPAGYGAPPAYGAVAPAPAPTRRRRLWLMLSAVAAAVVVVLAAGTIGYFRFLNPNAVPPASGATVSTAFVQLKVTSNWSKSLSRSSELELTNKGDGEMLVGYGNSGQDGITSNQSALSNLQTNLMFNTGNQVRQCVPQHGVSVGGKSGEEMGLRFDFQGSDLCEIAWVDYVSSSRYYFWNIGDDYNRVSKLQHDDAAMQETATWKV